jgi:hypothetical protein
MSRSAYCNTSYDLQKWLPSLHRMVLQEDMKGTDGIFPSGCTTFISSSALFSSYGFVQNDTLVIHEMESNEGVYHINSVVSNKVLILNRTSVTSAASISYAATKLLNRLAQDASDVVDEQLADLSHVIAVPCDKTLCQASLAELDDMDESIPLSLHGYLLDLEILSGPTFPAGITLTGYGEYLDWQNADVDVIFSSDDTKRPVTTAKSLTESITFTVAGTLTTTKHWREITEISAAYSGSGTLTIRYNVPRTVKRLTALEAAIQLVLGNYVQASPSRSEWLENIIEYRDKMYEEYRDGVRRLAELTESTMQRGRNRAVRLVRG